MLNILDRNHLNVAIVGGGITGLTVAIGLLSRKINCHVFERAASFREIGAGIGFSPNAERAMLAVDPRIHAAFKRVATPNASDYFQYVDGQHESDDLRNLFDVYLGERGFEGCARPDFLDEMAKLLPKDIVEFQKALKTVDNIEGAGKLGLTFEDGSMHVADIVIGCDGIHSRVRQLMLGTDKPESYPHYSHKYAVRGLIPMETAVAALGEYKPSTRLMYLGPDAHVLTFPVGMGTFLNVVGFATDEHDWHHDKLTAKKTKLDISSGFSKLGPTVRNIISMLPDTLEQWAVFDTYDHPAPTYTNGRVVLAGDAAHAAAPHHGAGAGFGIEDAAALCTLLAEVSEAMGEVKDDKKGLIKAALHAYDDVRRERCVWMVESSRFIGEAYQFQTDAGDDAEKLHREVSVRSHLIWDYDIASMLHQACTGFERRRGLN